MVSKWPYKRVEEIAIKVAMGPFGSSIKVETFKESGIPIISGQHLHESELTDSDFNFITEEHADRLKNSNVQRGDVIFTHAGNIGQVSFIPENSKYERYIISQRQFYLRCDTTIVLPEFITYFFESQEGQHKLLANANQVGVPSIARPSSYLKTIEVPVPPLDEQHLIVKKIRSIDRKIRLNRRTNQTLEAIAQAIFKSWFIDFDPVKAKIAALEQGEDPLRAAMRAISGKTDDELDQLPDEQYDELAATAELFPDAMEESELGMIPVGWTWQQIGEIATLPNDKIKSSELDTNNYISTENMLENRSGVTAAKSIPTATQVPGFRRGDVLISNIRPYFKKIWMATFEGGRSPDILSFRAKNSQDNVFLYNLLYQDEFFDFMMRTSKGAKMPRGDKHSISAWKFPFPSIELRTRFSREVLPSHIYTDRLINQNSLLSKTRNILLPYLLAEKTTPTINMQAT